MDAPSPTRRGLLRAAGTLVAAGATAVAGSAVGASPAAAATRPDRRTFGPRRPARRTAPVTTPRTAPVPAPAPTSPAPASALPAGQAFALHLIARTTYGVTPALLAEVTSTGPAAWLDAQLDPQGIDDSRCEAVVQRFARYHQDPPQLHAELKNGAWDSMNDTTRATLARACFSERQLLEVMVEFWNNHLNVTCPSSEVWATRAWEDRNVVRPHALGRFSDMLVASAKSPAMLHYLDGASSKGKAPNENYGRELLELHTVGRDAGYDQDGVVACARALTGLTTWSPWNGGTAENIGTFRYRADWRYVGPVALLGWSHPNADKAAGVQVAESLLRHLAAHPATAARLARKLCVRFVSDDPPAALVERLAAVYLASGTAVVPVLRALFASPEFAASVGRKYRRPYEDVVATVRVLGLQPSEAPLTRSFGDLVWELSQIGHAPLGWHPPDGYPDVAGAWIGTGTVLGRWNLHLGLASGWWKDGGFTYPGASLAARLLPGPRPATRDALVTALAARLMPGLALPVAHRDALVTFLGGPGPVKDGDVGGLFAPLVALLLDSPFWSVR